MKRVVILGAGSAGVMTANRMRKEFNKDELELIVIERKKEHVYQPAFTLLVFGLDEPENLVKPVAPLLYEGIKFIEDEATKIDPENSKVITSKHGEIEYDYLIIATGAKLDFESPEGMKEALEAGKNVFTFYEMDGALKLKEALDNFDGGTIVSTICEMPIKCPAAPIKFILMAEDYMRKRGIRHKCRFIFTTPMPAVFAREPYASALSKIFKDRGIEALSNINPASVDAENGVLEDYRGEKINFDLLCITPPHSGETVILNSEGVGDPVGWVTCDKNLMVHEKYKNIYALGDAANFPTSKTASGARKQAKVLVERMKAHIRGGEPKATYDGEIICPILTRFGRVMFAQFNYTESISPGIESYINWVLKVHMLRPLYWNLMLKGLM